MVGRVYSRVLRVFGWPVGTILRPAANLDQEARLCNPFGQYRLEYAENVQKV